MQHYKVDRVLDGCKSLNATFKRFVKATSTHKDLFPAGEALALWIVDLLVTVGVFGSSSEEGMLAFFDQIRVKLTDYTTRLEDAIVDKSLTQIPISEVVVCDRRYVGITGCVDFIHIRDGSPVPTQKIGQFLERINYSLPTLYLRHRTTYHSEESANDTITRPTAEVSRSVDTQ